MHQPSRIGRQPIAGVGVDMVENDRMRSAIQRWGPTLLSRLFTPAEISYCEKQAAPWRHYAGRFALKEAVAKAFGTGIGANIRWKDIEVFRKPGGAPGVRLHANARLHAGRHRVREVLVSVAHTHRYALAQAIILRDAGPEE